MTAPDAAGMSPYDPPGADGIRDFTIQRKPKRFRVDEDVFEAPPSIGGYALRNLGAMHTELGGLMSGDRDLDKIIALMAEMFQVLIPGPDGKLFAARLMSDGDPGDPEADPPRPPSPKPIGLMDQSIPILYWLLEQYGMRPTVPSSPSPTGLTDGQTDTQSVGTSSTDGALPEESATSNSPLTTGWT